ncbi:MAG: hypothetical protein R3F43_09730 [bacterium]
MEVDRATFCRRGQHRSSTPWATPTTVFHGVKTNQSLPDKGFQFSPRGREGHHRRRALTAATLGIHV